MARPCALSEPLYSWRPFLRKKEGLTLLKRRPGRHMRLETNTSMSHIEVGRFGPASLRVRIPVKRFLARPFSPKPAPDRAGVLKSGPQRVAQRSR